MKAKGKLPAVLRLYWLHTVGMTGLCVVYSTLTTFVFKLPLPYRLPGYFGEFAFFDFVIYRDRFRLFGKPGFWEFKDYVYTYPALTGVMYKLFYSLPHSLLSYLTLCAAAMGWWGWVLARGLQARGVARAWSMGLAVTMLLSSLPVFLLMTSGNMEGMMALGMALGVWAFFRGKPWWAAAAFGFAGAMKIYPLILLGLLLSRRRYREFGCGLLVSAALNYAALVVMGPTALQAQHHINEGLSFILQHIVPATDTSLMQFNHSLWYTVKYPVVLAARAMHSSVPQEVLLGHLFTGYIVTALGGGAAIYFLRLRRMPMLNQLLGLIVMGVLFAPMSVDYTLIQLLVPVGLLCWYAAEQEGVRPGLRGCFLCVPFILTAGTYYAWQFQFATQVRSLGLIALLVVTLRFAWPWKTLDEETA